MMFNPFKKKQPDGQPEMPKMGFLQSLMMKKLMRMDAGQRERLMQQALAPENIAQNKEQILAVLEQLQGGGMVSAAQAEEVRQKFGL